MRYIFPDYYKKFKCIADKCKHNCCIGWEIDIDEESKHFYDNVEGKMGERLKVNISNEGEPHFILGENERCPFLNNKNLCDIIIELGEDHICEICTAHPRFVNEFTDRIEAGIGLCCEEAARIILSKRDYVLFEIDEDLQDEGYYDEEYIILRDKVLNILQDRSIKLTKRIDKMLSLCSADKPDRNIGNWAEKFLKLERLDNNWSNILYDLRDNWDNIDIDGFNLHMKDRQIEYEQLMIYFIYRHFANAYNEIDMHARAAFSVLAYMIIYYIGAVIWSKTDKFDFEQQVEVARLFSSEIEYSNKNLDILLDELC